MCGIPDRMPTACVADRCLVGFSIYTEITLPDSISLLPLDLGASGQPRIPGVPGPTVIVYSLGVALVWCVPGLAFCFPEELST